MAASAAEIAVRSYLTLLHDPSALHDEKAVRDLERKLESAKDSLERLAVRQQLHEARNPSASGYEDEFITHAKAWADERGIGQEAFTDEGVSADVLRRAGFAVAGRGGRRGGRGGRTRAASTRSRVTVAEVRAAIPKTAFTLKQLQEASGASPAVVRKVVMEDMAEGRLASEGTSTEHRGPGRAPTLYKKAK